MAVALFIVGSAQAYYSGWQNKADIRITDGELRGCIASCLHVGQDLVAGSFERESLTVTLDAFVAADCDFGAFIGDNLGSSLYGGRDANGDPIYSPIGEYGSPGRIPTPEEAEELKRQLDAHPTWDRPTYFIAGNHDGDSIVLHEWHKNTNQKGFKGGPDGTTLDAFVFRTELECGAEDVQVDWLALGDTNRHQDIGVCGQLDTMEGNELRKSGAPAAHYTRPQLEFLRSRLARTAEIGRELVILAHTPPPETTFGTWEGEGREGLTGYSGQSLHGPMPTTYWDDLERPTYFWADARTGLNQPETCDAWNGTNAIQADGTADPDWWRRMLGDMESYTGDPHPVALWVGGHSHMPSPAWTQNGHGMWALDYPEGGGAAVPVIQTGGITRHHSGYGTSQFVVASIQCESRHIERWLTEPPWCSVAQCGDFWRPTSYPGEALVPRESW